MATVESRSILLALAGAAFVASAGAAEVSLLDRPGWIRTGDKERVAWNDGTNGKTLTIRQGKDAEESGVGTDFLDLDAFRGKEVEIVVTMDGEDVVRGCCATNRWAGDRRKPGPRYFSPVTYHWEIQFAEYANWFTPEFDFPPPRGATRTSSSRSPSSTRRRPASSE